MIPGLEQRVKRSVLFALPMVLVEMARHLTGWPELTHQRLVYWQFTMAVITSIIVFIFGWPLISKGGQSFKNRRLNMFSLIAPGILITYGYSLLALLAPGLFRESFLHQGHLPVYFEAAAMITTLVLIGQYIESRAERRTGDALEALGRLNPTRACVIRDGKEEWISADELVVGDFIQIRAGDRVPVDGMIIKGECYVDESMLTGEAMPVLKTLNAPVTGGTLVREGASQMRAEHVGSGTVLAQIIQMVKSAQESRAPIQRIADRVTGRLVPAVLLIGILTFIGWWIAGPSPSWWYGLLHAVTVLMITCPCALGLATPMSIVTGLGRGAMAGILIKDASVLERFAQIDTLVLDKTGTLTTGKPVLHACIPRQPGTESLLLKQAASLEHFSHHPIAAAIVDGAKYWGLTLEDVQDFKSVTGGGVAGTIHGVRIIAGRRSWLEELGVTDCEAMQSIASQFESEGGSVVWLASSENIAGIIIISDQLKPHAGAAIDALKKRNISLVMLTGDSSDNANAIARKLGIDHVISGVRPNEKADHIRKLKQQGGMIAMAGDGINDAPALASADVGIAIGTGTAVAVASGHVNIMKGDLLSLVHAFDLSHAVMKNIRQNLIFAFAYNMVMIPIAAGVLYPWTGIMLTPMLASAAMSASSITVILNALRLRKLKLT